MKVLHPRQNLLVDNMEEWKKITGFGDLYSVSNHGSVKSIHGNILYLSTTKKGYNRVQLRLESGKLKNPYVHRLVALAFMANPSNLPQINHIDGNKKNNNVSNLEWCTGQHNMSHAWKLGLKSGMKGEKNPRSKVTIQQVKEIRGAVLSKDFLRAELAKKYGVSVSLVKDIRSKRSWADV